MDKDDLFKVSDSLMNFLWIIQNNVLKTQDINKIIQASRSDTRGCCKDFSIPPSHGRVIFYLLHCNSSPISQIADSLGISKSNMTPIIDNLINYGLVNRFPDSDDRRVLRVELTQKAHDLLDAFRDAISNSFVEKISALSDDDVVLLNQSMLNLITLFKKIY
ncbi:MULTISPECIES: MarR family winged helix-turn-helix transcriptional regulator [Clostridium]|jgi:DNA-binding MarR family transcriptional regulator|uniref:Transcriptional regulator, MarR family n=1 Tax=Clostridium saccharoperbutylacetonicum N1-4(HMT) TaxID=931276 RepID=M1M831_9CLOT|nr:MULTISPECIES: MarR family transcriptional regulator [Clostridium]AGF54114.1 transcriptional regulator, MarR family [Clostridium saccharoperbutylacetonicum N1-4(HMT)]AQR93018.1 transcriptional regulator SlyA [Clostridium saccharoperbutylacetonicum]NRT59373.1 DNA-binding MarR family transcriptional regulator [Clostridium saccharoperbutylacetonicum]NSB28564.1 DNA-binding MarR family transcriptional regulator [Clostridium saccharoperbutylacetonicum]NSB34428.1 DNA-binding MarR family transcripti